MKLLIGPTLRKPDLGEAERKSGIRQRFDYSEAA